MEFYRGREYALDVLLAGGRYSWLVVLGAFMLVGMLATRLADNAGIIKRNLSGWGFMCWQNPDFCPLLTVAAYINPSSIGAAAITTLLLVGGLTFTAFP